MARHRRGDRQRHAEQLDPGAVLPSPYSFLELLALERPAWQAQAARLGADPALFFPERGEPTAPAEAIRAGCEVREDCLAYGIDTGARFGIWEGTSSRQRRTQRRDAPIVEERTEHLLIAMQAAELIGVDRSAFSRWTRDGRIAPAGRRRNGAELFDPAVERLRHR